MKHKPGTFTGNDEGVKFFAIYGVPVLWRTSENVRIRARAFGVNGLWGSRHESAFFDVRVFNPYSPSNHRPTPAAVYRRHEMEKRRSYEQRVREIEHSSFTPLVFSAVGGMGAAASVFYRRLASLLAEKQAQTYAKTIGWLRCTLSFSLMRSALMCIRGARSTKKQPDRPPALDTQIELAAAEGRTIGSGPDLV